MLTAYACDGTRLRRLSSSVSSSELSRAVWIDLIAPDEQEQKAVEAAVGLVIPSSAALSEIETSSRLNFDKGTFTLSMPLISREAGDVRGVPGGFVLSKDRLITIRFAPHSVFDRFAEREMAGGASDRSSIEMFAGLMEALIDRAADGLEQLRAEMDVISARIFRRESSWANKREDAILRDTLSALGRIGEVISLIRESQVGAERIIPYVARSSIDWMPSDVKTRLRVMQMDVQSLSDFDTHLNDKLQFLLDATLGFINIAQNNVMKVMTVTSVVGIPPVLMAGIWGMNFKNMPELNWAWGYPVGLTVIAVSALLPLVWFRLRDWI